MAIKIAENFVFGGVDSRSNPLNLPANRSLRCLNFIPTQGGWLELRKGFAPPVAHTALSATAIHSMFQYTKLDGTKYILFAQGNTLNKLALATGTITTIDTLSNSNPLSFFIATNRVHYGNGTDKRFYDDSVARDIGIRAPTLSEYGPVAIQEWVRGYSSAELAAITVGHSAGGTAFPLSGKGGIQMYSAIMDTSRNDLGRFTPIGSRQVLAAGDKIDVGSLPAFGGAYVHVLARTGDGDDNVQICAGGPFAVVTVIAATRNTSGVITFTCASPHNYTAGTSICYVSMTDAGDQRWFNGVYLVATTPTGTTFTVNTLQKVAVNSSGAFGNTQTVTSVVSGAVSLTNTTAAQNAPSLSIDASTVGGSQPGWQFYMCYYNPNTGAVSNRVKIGARKVNTSYPVNYLIQNLPNLSGVNSEWVKLIGRTGDGAEVPYPICDDAINWVYAGNTDDTYIVMNTGLDYDHELPASRNGVPVAFDKCARVGDRVYINPPNSASIYRSESATDQKNGLFTGQPEQSFGTAFDIFPTGEAVVGMAENDGQCFIGSRNDCAFLGDYAGVLQWQGPYPIGLAGARAWVKTPYGFFWLTGEKQLATISPQGPVIASEEYEAGLLALIGDAYLSSVELTYFRNAKQNADQIKIKGQDSNGNPILIIHDFRLNDARNPFGQGRLVTYQGALANNFTTCFGRDANGAATVFAGATDGKIYQLDNGDNDNGTEFSAEYIHLINFGTERPAVPWFEFFGDGNTVVSIAKVLNIPSTNDFLSLITEFMPGRSDNQHYRAMQLNGSEIADHAYLRLTLNSHSADGNTALNNPIHVPLETYGRVYNFRAAFSGEQRGG